MPDLCKTQKHDYKGAGNNWVKIIVSFYLHRLKKKKKIAKHDVASTHCDVCLYLTHLTNYYQWSHIKLLFYFCIFFCFTKETVFVPVTVESESIYP